MNFCGHRNLTDHRTVGLRAWCLRCGEWCYPNSACACCTIAMAAESPCSRCGGTGIEPETSDADR